MANKFIKKGKKKPEVIFFKYIASESFLFGVFVCLPLVIHDGYYDITETKAACFGVFSVFSAILYIVNLFLQLKDKEHIKKHFDKSICTDDVAFWAFVIIALISAVVSENQSFVWFGIGGRYQGFATIFTYFIIYFIISRSYKKSQLILIFAVTAFSIVCLLGVFNGYNIDVLGFYGELTDKNKSLYISTIGNINFYSSYICLLFPLIIYGFCSAQKIPTKVFFSITTIIGSLGAMVTSSESFVVGFLFSLLIMPLFFLNKAQNFERFLICVVLMLTVMKLHSIVYLSAEKHNVNTSLLLSVLLKPYILIPLYLILTTFILITRKKPQYLHNIKIIYIATIIFSLSGIILLIILINNPISNVDLGIINKYLKITDKWGTNRGRTWRYCWEKYKDLPILKKLIGIGPDSLYTITSESGFYKNKRLDQAHNEYLQYLITFGFLGMASYLSVITTTIIKVIKKLKEDALAVAMLCGCIAYWIQAFFNIAQPFTTPIMFAYVACIAGMYYNIVYEKSR